MTDLVIAEADYLEALAERIRVEYRRSRAALGDAIDSYFVIGQCLAEAREAHRSDQAFGEWFRAQQFGFTQQWAHVLRQAAEHETEVRAVVTTQVVTGQLPNIRKAVKQARAALGAGRSERPPLSVVDVDEFAAVVIDPPWQYDNTATRGAAEDHYPTMTVDELTGLDIPTADNAHVYLWATNAFLRQAFVLLDAWGLTYKTCLTWCKPSIGMGNYFRNNTEHVLFAVKGSLPTQRSDTGTWFGAPRGRHSSKPEAFYDLVEACSPGPYLEMFARRRRLGWSAWGNEA